MIYQNGNRKDKTRNKFKQIKIYIPIWYVTSWLFRLITCNEWIEMNSKMYQTAVTGSDTNTAAKNEI